MFQAVTASVIENVRRINPCANPNPCTVVVNPNANTSALCLAWSQWSYWDGSSCVGRCELLGGVLDPTNTMNCSLNNAKVRIYNASEPNINLFMAPIQCGTWLGPRDSAWQKSWFSSECTAILQNRWDTRPAIVSECNATMYAPGCRFLDTNQKLVPLCRENNSTMCGVPVQCPSKNPCGLLPDIDSNLNNKFMQCATQTHLALNVSSDETGCTYWSPYAFLLDGYCVSSCGRYDNKCILDGVSIPPCNVQRSFQDNSIIDISPTICSVPMPSDTFAGFRNGFYGMSRAVNSKCLVTPSCTNSSMCFRLEGLNITPLAYESSTGVPFCNGDLSKQCKIEYPCSITEQVFSFECSLRILWISEAMYTGMGVSSCEWFLVRDIIIIILWFVAVVVLCYLSIRNLPFAGTIFVHLGIPSLPYYDSLWVRICMDIFFFLVLMGLVCIWEIVLILGIIVGSFLSLKNGFTVESEVILPTRTSGVAAVRIDHRD